MQSNIINSTRDRYLEDFREHAKALKELEPEGDCKRERKKNQKRLDDKRKQIKVLIKYLDKDYAETKKSLYPMLESGIVTYDFLWALWKPNILLYSTMYGSAEDPRIFKLELATRHQTVLGGDSYLIDGKYLEFDGKGYGHAAIPSEIDEFRGTRKITSLPIYPLKYHKTEQLIRQQLIERGKKFIALSGSHYKAYAGIAYMRDKKGSIVKFNIQKSRIMVDPATFRRTNPNYLTSNIRPGDYTASTLYDASDEEVGPSSCSRSEEEHVQQVISNLITGRSGQAIVHQTVTGDKGRLQRESQLEPISSLPDVTDVQKDTDTPFKDNLTPEELSEECSQGSNFKFSDEDYLVASPVVLGFSFSEKQWVEFAVSRIQDINWNDGAWDSLVLGQETKDLIQALVKSRKNHATQTIDDVIQGKGKGLVSK